MVGVGARDVEVLLYVGYIELIKGVIGRYVCLVPFFIIFLSDWNNNLQLFPILNQRSVEQRAIWIVYYSNCPKTPRELIINEKVL